MDSPWPHMKESINLLGSLQLHTPKEHPDYLNVTIALNKMRELHLFVKKVSYYNITYTYIFVIQL